MGRVMRECPEVTVGWKDDRRRAVVAAMEARGVDEAKLARLTGLHPKTIRRFLGAETFDLGTLDRIEAILRIPPTSADTGAPAGTIAPPSPVVGWAEAARVLRMSRNTLLRRRKDHGDKRPYAWWDDVPTLKAWYNAMTGMEAR